MLRSLKVASIKYSQLFDLLVKSKVQTTLKKYRLSNEKANNLQAFPNQKIPVEITIPAVQGATHGLLNKGNS